MERPLRKAGADHLLVASMAVLLGVGLVTLYSASYSFSERWFNNKYYLISRQLIYSGIGIVLFIAASVVPLKFVRAMVPVIVILSVVLCLLTFVPFTGSTKNGASRWIKLGIIEYQPSELVKLALPLYLAHFFDKKREQIDSFARGILHPTMATTLFFLLIYFQNNFSTALFIMINGLLIFFMAGVKIRYFLAAAVILAPICALLVFTSNHRLSRVITFLWREKQDPLGAAYQVRMSMESVAAGGFWGTGFGMGLRKISSVPEIHSDFIFASYAEEAGFAGVLLFYVMFLVFIIRGYQTAMVQEEIFSRLLTFGLVTTIGSQALINIGVTSGALPVTGIPLPFFSHGGSSLVTTFIMTGLIVNASRFKNKAEVAHVC
ncbi:MAG: putative lipid II flippase FtsW [Treponema sp.]|nr:putative lipid II flippase FtsW [Treponema sp.]